MSLRMQEIDTGMAWEVRYFKKVIARGVEDTEEEADRKVQAALGKFTSEQLKHEKDLNGLNAKLRYILKNRMAVLMFVVEMMLEGRRRKEICEDAKAGEISWSKRLGEDPPENRSGRGRQPMEANEVAERAYNLIYKLGLVKKVGDGELDVRRLKRYATSNFGPWWGDDPESIRQRKMIKRAMRAAEKEA